MASETGFNKPDWQIMPLESAMDAIIDYRGKSPQKTSFGVPLITAKIVKDGRILPPEEFIASEDYDEWMRRGLPKPGDIVITTEAPLGEVAQLDYRKVALAQRLIALRGKPGLLDNTFLKFLLRSEPIQALLRSRSTGTTVLGIRQSELRQVPLPIPPFKEQRAIAHVLGTLDDKIELNRKMNETLEAMARALFKSWFVDFDPVRVKAEGRDPGLPAPIAALFPDSFEDSELGGIPKGWSMGKFGDVASNSRRGISASEIRSDTPYIALEHMPRKSIALTDWGTANGVESGKLAFNANEILFGKLRPYFHKVGIAPIDGVCSTDIVVVTPRSSDWFGFVLGHASNSDFVEHTNAGSTGTKMPRTNWSEMARYQVALPPEPLAKVFTEQIQSAISRIVASIHENRTLAVLRETLLPKLISGEIRIKIPETHEEVVAVVKNIKKTTQASDQFKEAVLIAALVRLASTPQYPLGNFRRTKFSYLVHRKAAHDVQRQYLKKAAGPYDPKSKYAGPVKIAIQNGYVIKVSSTKGEGLVSGEKVQLIDEYLPRYEFADAIDWVLQKFKFSKNDDLELFTTVDLAALEIKGKGDAISVDAIIGVIENDAEWKAKLDRALFSPENIQRALQTMAIHFPETYQ